MTDLEMQDASLFNDNDAVMQSAHRPKRNCFQWLMPALSLATVWLLMIIAGVLVYQIYLLENARHHTHATDNTTASQETINVTCIVPDWSSKVEVEAKVSLSPIDRLEITTLVAQSAHANTLDIDTTNASVAVNVHYDDPPTCPSVPCSPSKVDVGHEVTNATPTSTPVPTPTSSPLPSQEVEEEEEEEEEVPVSAYDLLEEAGLTEHKGWITVWTDNWASVVFEVSGESMYTLFLVDATYNSGNADSSLLHMPAARTDYQTFYWAMSTSYDHLLLCKPQVDLRTSDTTWLESLYDGASPNCIWSTKIIEVRTSGSGDTMEFFFLVDATALVLSHGWFLYPMTKVITLESMQPTLRSVASYPLNVNLIVALREIGDAESDIPDINEVEIYFAIAKLPDQSNTMKTRRADDRVGFFTTNYIDLGSHIELLDDHVKMNNHDKVVKLVNRWRLETLNNGNAKKPITYHIDPTVPRTWRPFFKKGVEAWQKAFDRIGIKKAIRAVLEDDEDWPADYSAGDLRYSSISWALSTSATYALGPSTVDIRTGEIINADIVFTHGWISVYLQSFRRFANSNPGILSSSASSSVKRDVSAHSHSHSHDEHNHNHDHLRSSLKSNIHPRKLLNNNNNNNNKNDVVDDLKQFEHADSFHSRIHCQHERLSDISNSPYAAHIEMLAQIHENALLTGDFARSVDDTNDWQLAIDIIGAALQDTVMHEVGHTLGMRHNFKATAAVPNELLHNKDYTQRFGVSTSVMDYYPVNFQSDALQPQGDYFQPVVGPYDHWAIEYAYSIFPIRFSNVQAQLDDERKKLQAIASRGSTPEFDAAYQDFNAAFSHSVAVSPKLVFSTDEDLAGVTGEDPYTNYWDLGAAPEKFYAGRLDFVKRLQKASFERAIDHGADYTALYRMQLALIADLENTGKYLTKFLGGRIVSKSHNGDSDRTQPVTFLSDDGPASDAFDTICKIWTDDFGFFNSTLYSHMVTRRYACTGILDVCDGLTSSGIAARVDLMNARILFTLLDKARLERVRENQFIRGKVGPDSVVSALLEKVSSCLFSEKLTKSFVGKDLQSFFIDLLIYLSGNVETSLEEELADYLVALSNALVSHSSKENARIIKIENWKMSLGGWKVRVAQ